MEENNNENFNELILNILQQNDEFKSNYGNFSRRKVELQNNAETAVLDLLSAYSTYNRINESIVKLVDLSAVKMQIEKVKDEISALTKASNLSPEEIKTYKELSQKIEENEKIAFGITSKIDDLVELKEYVETLFGIDLQKLLQDKINAILAGNSNEENSQILTNVVHSIGSELEPTIKSASNRQFMNIDQLRISKNKIEAETKTARDQIKPLFEKINNQEKLHKLQGLLAEQQSILNEISTLSQKKQAIAESLPLKFKEIWTVRKTINQSYEDLLESISNLGLNSISNDIKLEVKKVFSEEDFNKFFSPLVDLRTVKSQFPENYNDSKGITGVDSAEFLERLFRKIITSEVKMRAGNEIQDALTRIVRDYFKLKYNLIYKNDEISKMSPGKRGLVLLQLILHVSNSKEPILIDQPEDNLDNRTIFEELNEFIRVKKKFRQILMVTHNPNLVVSTDAENVIVANQSGQSLGKDNKHFQFEYVSGSLENSFVDHRQQGILYQKGIREHVCEVLEGGEEAFKTRQKRYSFRE